MTSTLDAPAPESNREIGRDRRRKEDAHLITGHTTWTDNMTLPGMVHLAVLALTRTPPRRSPRSTCRPPARPAGVVGVWSGEDFPEQGGLPCAWPITADMKAPTHNAIAVGSVKHAGEIVAVVAARSKTDAVDAAEMIEVEYEPVAAVIDMPAALADGRPTGP